MMKKITLGWTLLFCLPLWISPSLARNSNLEKTMYYDLQEKNFTKLRGGYQYLLYFPKNYKEEKSFPLLLFLHGAGTRGDDLETLKRHVPIQFMIQDGALPFVVVAPLCPDKKQWESGLLNSFLSEVILRNAIDEHRVYLTGISMGGYGAFQLATAYPERFAALVPVCGAARMNMVKNLLHVPIWTFHGAKDTVVPIQYTASVVKELQKYKQADVRFTVYPDAGHDIWNRAYGTSELYSWMLSQRTNG